MALSESEYSSDEELKEIKESTERVEQVDTERPKCPVETNTASKCESKILSQSKALTDAEIAIVKAQETIKELKKQITDKRAGRRVKRTQGGFHSEAMSNKIKRLHQARDKYNRTRKQKEKRLKELEAKLAELQLKQNENVDSIVQTEPARQPLKEKCQTKCPIDFNSYF